MYDFRINFEHFPRCQIHIMLSCNIRAAYATVCGIYFSYSQGDAAETISEQAVSELSDKTNQMDLEDSSQASSEQLEKQPRRRGKRTKKGLYCFTFVKQKQYSLCYFDCDESAGVQNTVVYVDLCSHVSRTCLLQVVATGLFMELGNAAV